MGSMNWPQSKLSHFWVSLILAAIVSVAVFHHRFNAHYRLYTTEVASPGETVPYIDPFTAGIITFIVTIPVCYIAQRVATAPSRRAESADYRNNSD